MGKAKRILDAIIVQRAGRNEVIARSIAARLMIKGINVKAITMSTPDDPAMIKRLLGIARDMDVKLPILE
ncbi:MAG: hypothetical protein P4L33_03070 [Capsulimonadaceae bacterium]|nr:hypothetical protein [Capsulimonadaceae bacterium]